MSWRGAGLVVAGAAGAVVARRVYEASVAFPNAVREAGQKISQDIREMREWGDQLEALLTEAGVPRRRWRSEWFVPPRLRSTTAPGIPGNRPPM